MTEGMNGMMQGFYDTVNMASDSVSDLQAGLSENVNTAAWKNFCNLMDTIQSSVSEVINMNNLHGALNLSDEIAQTTAQLERMDQVMGGSGSNGQELMKTIYMSAQDARNSLEDMSFAVVQFGSRVENVFESSKEVIDFANLVQKQIAMAGVSVADSQNAMLQLAQAMGTGTMSALEFNNIFKTAPNLIQNIADYLNEPIERIQQMAVEGELSANVIKNAVFAAADDIDTAFDQMPMTWEQIRLSIQNSAKIAFQSVLQELNNIANSEKINNFVNTISQGISAIANSEALHNFIGNVLNLIEVWSHMVEIRTVVGSVVRVFEALLNTASLVLGIMSICSPVIYGIVAAFIAYKIVAGVVTVINGVLAFSERIKNAAQMLSAGSTLAATAAQYGFNTALMACPITWIIVGIIAFITIIYTLCAAIAKMTGVAGSGLGFIVGCINVVLAAFLNLGMLIGNIMLGVWEVIKALCTNIVAAFHNAISSVKGWFFGLLSTVLITVAGICEALNRLPFISFDYSGIEGAANDYAAKALEEANKKKDYTNILDAFNKGFHTYEAFQDGWAENAFDEGVSAGDEWAKKISDFFSDLTGGAGNSAEEKYQRDVYELSGDVGAGSGSADAEGGGGTSAANNGQTAASLNQTAINTGQTAANTAAIAGALDITNEQLKYLRDIAERDVVNRYTTANIKVEMTNNNNINSDMDLDGVMDNLAAAVQSAMSQAAEGVHF